MTDLEEPLVRPSPLRDDPNLGLLLRQATLEYGAELDEAAAYRRLSAGLARRAARNDAHSRRWPVLVVALVGSAAAVALLLDRSSFESIAPSSEYRAPSMAQSAQPATGTGPESEPPREPEPRVEDGAEQPAAPAPAPAALEPRPKEAANAPKEASSAKPEREQNERQSKAVPPAALDPESSPASVDCLALARSGEPRSAERCFSERAQGSGLEAEMALYEAARLRVDVLGDAESALSALSEHRQRFPRGSLRREVDMFRVELLARLGHAREALVGSEELLSAAGGERAADLYLLRGNVYRQTLNDPAAAEREYARAEPLGGASGAQATYLRGLCFETLGNHPAAIASFQRYTSVPGRPRASDALARLRRLEQLSGAAQPARSTP